jgi:hypothetical protein
MQRAGLDTGSRRFRWQFLGLMSAAYQNACLRRIANLDALPCPVLRSPAFRGLRSFSITASRPASLGCVSFHTAAALVIIA